MKRVLALCLVLLTLTGCMGGGSEIVLPQRQPVGTGGGQKSEHYLVVGNLVLGLRTGDGSWQPLDRLPEGITGWTIFGPAVTHQEKLPDELPSQIPALSGEAQRPALQTDVAWEPAADLLYALIRSITATEPLQDPPAVTLLGSGDLTGEGGTCRLLAVQGSYDLLIMERNGEYTALPDCTRFLDILRVENQTVLLCADGEGKLRLLTWQEGWNTLLVQK